MSHNPISSKETYKGKINVYETMTGKNDSMWVTVGYAAENRKDKRKLSPRQTHFGEDYGFTFDGTEWYLNYDFNLKLDSNGSIAEEEVNENGNYPFFVYGTLRWRMRNNSILEGTYDSAERAITKGLLYHNGSFPYLYEGAGEVHGEVYYPKDKIYNRLLFRLDSLEGFNRKGDRHNHYNRELVDVTLESGKTIKAWCYFANDKHRQRITYLTLIKDGDYVRWHKEYLGSGREGALSR